MFARLRRRMNRQAQAQEQEDFEFCTCDVCMRELRRAAEKEALEAAAKQQLMVRSFNSACPVLLPSPYLSIQQPGAFPPDGQDAGKWIKDLTQYGVISLPHILGP
jgi:hypothetical protein